MHTCRSVQTRVRDYFVFINRWKISVISFHLCTQTEILRLGTGALVKKFIVCKIGEASKTLKNFEVPLSSLKTPSIRFSVQIIIYASHVSWRFRALKALYAGDEFLNQSNVQIALKRSNTHYCWMRFAVSSRFGEICMWRSFRQISEMQMYKTHDHRNA